MASKMNWQNARPTDEAWSSVLSSFGRKRQCICEPVRVLAFFLFGVWGSSCAHKHWWVQHGSPANILVTGANICFLSMACDRRERAMNVCACRHACIYALLYFENAARHVCTRRHRLNLGVKSMGQMNIYRHAINSVSPFQRPAPEQQEQQSSAAATLGSPEAKVRDRTFSPAVKGTHRNKVMNTVHICPARFYGNTAGHICTRRLLLKPTQQNQASVWNSLFKKGGNILPTAKGIALLIDRASPQHGVQDDSFEGNGSAYVNQCGYLHSFSGVGETAVHISTDWSGRLSGPYRGNQSKCLLSVVDLR